MVEALPASAVYDRNNLLDRHTAERTLELNYAHMQERERDLLHRHLPLRAGRVLSVGCGWHPGRHLFPAPQFDLVAADADPAKVAGVVETHRADAGIVGYAGQLNLPPRSFDVVLYRLVLHHLVFQGPLTPAFTEAAELLKPGGALIAVEPGLWHPVGAGLTLANRAGLGTRVHGTPDDVPLSPRRLRREAMRVGLEPQLHAVTFSWRRLPQTIQRALWPIDQLGSRRRLAPLGHTVMLIARRPG